MDCVIVLLNTECYCAELILAAVLLLSTLYDATIYVSTPLQLSPIKLTTKQMQMLKVDKKSMLTYIMYSELIFAVP